MTEAAFVIEVGSSDSGLLCVSAFLQIPVKFVR